MEWPQGGTPEESYPAYRGPVFYIHEVTFIRNVQDPSSPPYGLINYLVLDNIISQSKSVIK